MRASTHPDGKCRADRTGLSIPPPFAPNVMTDSEENNYWPGYVAAMASLVQSLLLLAVILAYAIYEMGLLAGKRVDQAVALAMADESVQPVPLDEDTKRDPAKLVQKLKTMGTSEFEFPLNIWQLDDESSAQVRTEVKKRMRQHPGAWLIWVETDTDHAFKRRLAYLRIMVVRNELIRAGIQAPQIETRILNKQNPGNEGEDVIRLVELTGTGVR